MITPTTREDFSTPYLDEDRFKEAFPKSQNKSKKATEKKERTRQAYDKTLSRFNKTPTDEQDKWIPYE